MRVQADSDLRWAGAKEIPYARILWLEAQASRQWRLLYDDVPIGRVLC
jgi:hypothetical protein